jgi:predicted molibdopterin-dependent oxidoreductase YjgC
MFKRLDDAARALNEQPIQIFVDDRPLTCRAGDSVAAALLAAGIDACRETVVSGSARGPYCMMGVCYDCLVQIDGIANRQGCMTPVSEGMQVRRQRGAREVRT